jgi:hypothetical protein
MDIAEISGDSVKLTIRRLSVITPPRESVTKVSPGQMNARTPNTIAAGISRAVCIEFSSNKHCGEITHYVFPKC